MNEQEAKSGGNNFVCSVTGKRCLGKCDSSGCGGRLDNPPKAAVQWTKSALCRVDIVEGDIERAVDACLSERGYPGPELREARRIASALRSALEACLL